MTKQPIDEEKIREYLLGLLPEGETDSLDERSLTDNEFAAQLTAAENELVDAYVRDELPEEAHARFESRYLASPRRREKVAFARTMQNVLEQRSIPTIKDVPVKRNWFRFLNAPWQFAAVTLVIVLVLSGYVLYENSQLRRQLTLAQTGQESLQQREKELIAQLSRQHSSVKETGKELARVQERLKELEQQQQQQARDSESLNANQKVQLIAYHLTPQRRNVSNVPLLRIPQKVDFLVLTLDLDASDFAAYQAVLRDSGTGEILWHSSSLKPNPNGSSVTVKMPALGIKPQVYMVELAGISPGSASEIVNSYLFRAIVM